MNNIIKKYIGKSSLMMAFRPDGNRHCDDFML